MTKEKTGNWFIGLSVLVYIVLWFVFAPDDGLAATRDHVIGEMLAGATMILLSISIFLSTKPKWAEPYFGGLDKMYSTHRQIAIIALLLLIGHFYTIPTGKTGGPGLWLGMIAFYGFLISILLALAPRLPFISNFFKQTYTKWRNVHRLVGIMYLLSIFHYLMVEPHSLATPQGFYMLAFAIFGGGSWLYKQAFAQRMTPFLQYEVESVNRLNGSIIELVLKPLGEGLEHAAGQFAFIHFETDEILKEPHPFTIASAPGADRLRIAIKNSGDWTGYLYDMAQPGMVAQVAGGHGMFNYKNSPNDQIWVAGGIGVTPFASWVRDMRSDPAQKINFFYTVRSDSDVIFYDEFESAAQQHDNLNAHLQVSNENGRLTPDLVAQLCGEDISKRSVYLCGPVKMTESMAEAFQKMGVASSNIHFEEFNFR